MCSKRTLAKRRPNEGGFTFTETLIVIAVITAMSAGALVFYFGRLEIARRHAVIVQLAEAIRSVEALPAGNPLTWEVAAQKLLADVMYAAAPSAATPAGTRADLLPSGLHVGRTVVAGQALMRDASGMTVSIAGCAIDDLQVTVYPVALPVDNELRDAGSEWMRSQLEVGIPELIVTVQEAGLFCCLPR